MRPLGILVVAAAAYAFSQNEGFGPASPLYRFLMWVAIFGVGYGLVVLGSAQLRRHAQPFDHTLVMTPGAVTLTDNLRRRTQRYAWTDFRRVRINDQAYELTLRASPRGESYVIRRARLSREEDVFLGERLVEL